MKTAISLPDDTFNDAERYAKTHGLTRSELYATAVREYLERRERENLIARINAVCAEVDTSLDPALERLQTKSTTPAEDWT